MTSIKINTGFIILFFFVTTVFAQKTPWAFDKTHSKIQFVVTHMSISDVSGRFKSFSGSVKANKEDFTDAEIAVIIKVNSIDTDNEKRDSHLMNEDFFHEEKYPEISFTSSQLKKTAGGYQLTGPFTIKDVTKTETFDVDYKGTITAMGKTRAGFKITGTINRFDYNINWDRSFGHGLILGKEVDIICDVELVKEEGF